MNSPDAAQPLPLSADPAVHDMAEKDRLIDDLWLSYYARRRGWRLQRSAALFVPIQHDGKGLAADLAQQKTGFRRMLQRLLRDST